MRPYLALLFSLARQVRQLRTDLAAARCEVDRLTSELVVQQARVRRWRQFVEAFAPHLPEQARTAVHFQTLSDDIADLPETENR